MAKRIENLEKELSVLRQENSMLRNFVNASRDALFCIEFKEPIDLTAPETEIIRQTFENESVWRLCNPAMARLYKLPDELDFNEQDVHFVFGQNPENEEFVRNLIGAEFNIDGVMSLDENYSGHKVYMENDIRSTIKDGKMHQMYGAVRNVNQNMMRERALSERLVAMSNVLSAIPDPIVVLDMDGILQAANPAFEWEFGWILDDVLGKHVHNLITFPEGFSISGDIPTLGSESLRLSVEMLNSSGNRKPCKAHISSYGGSVSEGRIVVTLLSEKALKDLMTQNGTELQVEERKSSS
jgi:PAS domain S-box-containing protein